MENTAFMKDKKNDRKISLLREQGTLNTHSTKVICQLFLENEFFDPHDLVQVKYEMLRWVHLEKGSIKEAVKSFGCSRPTFYQALSSFEQEGLAGLIPKKRGPKNRHKLSEEILRFIRDAMMQDHSLSLPAIVLLIKERYGLEIHSRSVKRALDSKKITDDRKKK